MDMNRDRNYQEGYQQGWHDAWQAAHKVLPALHDAMNNGQRLHDLMRAVEWLQERYEQCPGDPYPCNCEPYYESDTNAWNHAEDYCTQGAGDHFTALVDQAKEAFKEVPKLHEPYPPL